VTVCCYSNCFSMILDRVTHVRAGITS